MAKYNHSKFKNTYLIFEFLIRQLTNELIVESDVNKSKTFGIIKKYFTKGILKEELNLYQALLNNHIPKEYTADKLIEECVRRYKKLNRKVLNSERYKLIGEIKENYNIDKLFSAEIEDYKEAGNVFFLFESIRQGDIVEKSKRQGIILENITQPKEEKKSVQIFESIKKASPENRKLAYLILVERFNKKYAGVLNEGQRKYIKDYIYNQNNSKNWINKHVSSVMKEINSYRKMLKEGTEQDQILQLKVNETLRKLDYLRKKKIFEKSDHNKVLLGYKLVEQLNEFNNV